MKTYDIFVQLNGNKPIKLEKGLERDYIFEKAEDYKTEIKSRVYFGLDYLKERISNVRLYLVRNDGMERTYYEYRSNKKAL